LLNIDQYLLKIDRDLALNIDRCVVYVDVELNVGQCLARKCRSMFRARNVDLCWAKCRSMFS